MTISMMFIIIVTSNKNIHRTLLSNTK